MLSFTNLPMRATCLRPHLHFNNIRMMAARMAAADATAPLHAATNETAGSGRNRRGRKQHGGLSRRAAKQQAKATPPREPPPWAIAREGSVLVQVRQRTHTVDVTNLQNVLKAILELTNCRHMDVGVLLSSDAYVRRLNGPCNSYLRYSIFAVVYFSLFPVALSS